jgi:hypothetical protein
LWLPKFLEKKVLSRQTEEEISKHTQKDAKESSHEEQSRHQELHLQQEQHNIQRKEEQENLHRQEEGRGNDLQLKEQTKQKRHHILQQEQLNLQRKEEETSMQQQQDLPRKVEVQPNIHEEKLPPESQQKQPVSPLSPSATRKYHLSHISKTPQCEALTPAESSTLIVNNSLASLRTPQQQRRLVNPLSVGTETANATPATRIPLVKLKRILSNSKPKIARSNSAGKISPVKEELCSRKALRSVDQSKKKKPQPLCDGLFNTS